MLEAVADKGRDTLAFHFAQHRPKELRQRHRAVAHQQQLTPLVHDRIKITHRVSLPTGLKGRLRPERAERLKSPRLRPQKRRRRHGSRLSLVQPDHHLTLARGQIVGFAGQPFVQRQQRVPIILSHPFVAGQQAEPRQRRAAPFHRQRRVLFQPGQRGADPILGTGVSDLQAFHIIDRQTRCGPVFLAINARCIPIQPKRKGVHVVAGRGADNQGLAVALGQTRQQRRLKFITRRQGPVAAFV